MTSKFAKLHVNSCSFRGDFVTGYYCNGAIIKTGKEILTPAQLCFTKDNQAVQNIVDIDVFSCSYSFGAFQ